jgi:hypothetical protein
MPFGITPFTRAGIAALKNAIRDQKPELKSSHLDEAIAFGFGFETYAAMLPVLELSEANSCMSARIDANWFALRLHQLGYDPRRFIDVQPHLWSPPGSATKRAEKRTVEAADIFKPWPANDG